MSPNHERPCDELKLIREEIKLMQKHNDAKWAERERRYEDAKKSYHHTTSRIEKAVDKLFEKTDKMEEIQGNLDKSVNLAVNSMSTISKNVQDNMLVKSDLDCEVYETQIKSLGKDVGRLFGWFGAIMLWLMGATAVLTKKIMGW